MSEMSLLRNLVGSWSGNCRTWFEPEKLADESRVDSHIQAVFEGCFVRHSYRGAIQGKPRIGEELIAFNSVTELFQVSWIDDFHMNYAILFSQGTQTNGGFSVVGQYDVGEKQPRWGWRTNYECLESERLLITAYNISPEGFEAKAVETDLRRVG